MRFLLPIILFYCMIITCYSTIQFERQIAKPGHENECYDKENDVYYKKGDLMKWNMKYCGQKVCRGSDGKGRVYIESHTCPKINVPPGCHIDVNSEQPYPECCGKIVCPEFENFNLY